MKKLSAFLVAAVLPLLMWAGQGWPTNYQGVMLQGFYWDSYIATNFQNLISQAPEMGQYFDLIWIPNTGSVDQYGTAEGMGYSDVYWLKHDNVFGQESDLRQLIATYKKYNTGMIADFVVNHKTGATDWCDFPDESVVGQNTGKTYSMTWTKDAHDNDTREICKDDECYGKTDNRGNLMRPTGNNDTGQHFDGSRDLDHTYSKVQTNVKTFLDYLINELGYEGIRIDMTKGYSASYTGQYNASQSSMKYSVGENWDGNADNLRNWINGTKYNGTIQSATFDFVLKYTIKSAFGGGNWSALSDKGLAADATYKRYAVTFVDNHDTGQKSNADVLKNNVMAANAFILMMPGTPCVFLKHYLVYTKEIQNCIKARHAAGVHNQSTITTQQQSGNGYIIATKGTRGNLYIQLGEAINNATPSGYKLVQAGDNYKLFITSSIDWEHASKAGAVIGYPVVDKPAGTYAHSVTVNVRPSSSSYPVVYTTDGSTPTVNSQRLTAATSMTFDKNTTLKVGVVNGTMVENTASYIYTIADEVPSKLRIYIVSNSSVSSVKPCIYAWNKSGSSTTEYAGSWPGKQIATLPVATINGQEWHYLEVNGTSANVIFNTGARNAGYEKQTATINVTRDSYFLYPDADLTTTANDPYDTYQDVTELYEGGVAVSKDTKLYVIGHVLDNEWDPGKVVEMTTTDGEVYTAYIDFKVGASQDGVDYSWFSFTKRKATLEADKGGWGQIASYRFGAPSNDYLITQANGRLGKPITCGLMRASRDNAFMLVTGKYKLTVGLNSRQLVVEEWNGEPPFVKGDVNGDGVVDVRDVSDIIDVVLGKKAPGELSGDCHVAGNESIDVSDVTALINIVLGK